MCGISQIRNRNHIYNSLIAYARDIYIAIYLQDHLGLGEDPNIYQLIQILE
jgi:hypothetical protein